MAKKQDKNRQRKRKIDAGLLLKVFRGKSKPLAAEEIYDILKPNRKERVLINNLLEQLQREGKLIRVGKGKAYGLAEKMDLVRGKLQVQRSGVGFVLPDDRRRKDVFVASDNINDAWHGDRVVAALLPGRKGKNPEGRIVRVLERLYTRVPALLMKNMGENLFWAQPTDRKMNVNFMVDVSGLSRSPDYGEVVVVEAGEKLDPRLWSGRATRFLGREEDALVQEEIVKMLHDIPREFSSEALQEAAALPSEPETQEIRNRRDLSDIELVTIDGAKAKDFDDAVCVYRSGRNYKLYVAIADVTHYVQPGSALDREARERANSYYFPQSVEPMFPPALSNELCSLNPGVPRLVVAVEMTLSPAGELLQSSCYPAAMVSKARLTYSQVKKALLDGDTQEQENLGSGIMDMLRRCEELARILNRCRRQRGSLDFDLPEPELLFNIQNETVDIRPKVRHFGHQIIEEFMIAANEAVASRLESRDLPCMYRVHPEPDQTKLQMLFQLLEKTSVGDQLPEDTSPKSLQRLLQSVEDTGLDFLVNRLLLRTMMQASYSPDNQGHFGLASDCYCHFTSPIRRYADMLVHRYLKADLGVGKSGKLGYKRLHKLGEHLSDQERKGTAAEREIVNRLTVLFLQDKVGQSFNGVISSLMDFGFWVELTDVMADGLVRLSTLTDDYYVLWQEDQKLVGKQTGRIFTLGQKVRVRLANVSVMRQEIDLELEEAQTKTSGRKGRKARGAAS
jgi:ribonuclease R